MKETFKFSESVTTYFELDDFTKKYYLEWCKANNLKSTDKHNLLDYILNEQDISNFEVDYDTEGFDLDNKKFLEWLNND